MNTSTVDRAVILKLRCTYQNTRGIRTKLLDVFNYLSTSTSDILVLTETWLGEDIPNGEFCPDNYTVYRGDRDFTTMNVSRGGGVLICVNSAIRSIPLDLSQFRVNVPTIDIVGIKIFLTGQKLSVFGIYSPAYNRCNTRGIF